MANPTLAVKFALCASVGALQLFSLSSIAGGAQAPPPGAAVHLLLPAASTVAFFLGVTLNYVHLYACPDYGDGAGNGPISAEAVEHLTKMTIGVALATVALSLIVVIVAFNTAGLA